MIIAEEYSSDRFHHSGGLIHFFLRYPLDFPGFHMHPSHLLLSRSLSSLSKHLYLAYLAQYTTTHGHGEHHTLLFARLGRRGQLGKLRCAAPLRTHSDHAHHNLDARVYRLAVGHLQHRGLSCLTISNYRPLRSNLLTAPASVQLSQTFPRMVFHLHY